MDDLRRLTGMIRWWRVVPLLAALLLGASAGQASVTPPLTVELALKAAAPDPDGMLFLLGEAANRDPLTARVDLDVKATGVLQLVTAPSTLGRPDSASPSQFAVSARLSRFGVGTLTVKALAFDEKGAFRYGSAQSLFFSYDSGALTVSVSSEADAVRRRLDQRLDAGQIDRATYDREMKKLLGGQGKTTREPAPAKPKTQNEKLMERLLGPQSSADVRTAAAGGVAVTGKVTYEAPGAVVRNVPLCRVRFYESPAMTELTTSPAEVATDAAGGYSATVSKADGSAPAAMVVRVFASVKDTVWVQTKAAAWDTADRTKTHFVSSAVVTNLSTPVNIAISEANPSADTNRAFAVIDGVLNVLTYYKQLSEHDSVGAAPGEIWVEYPGENAKGSYYWDHNGHHLNIGQGHGYDWDVIFHEYGHYVQKINAIADNIGGKHWIATNMFGVNRGATENPAVLSKEQAVKMAYAEGWPTFFGTLAQVSMGMKSYGLANVGDTKYWDSANAFGYDLEDNADQWRGAGEDNELSAQRVLWDLYDAGGDEGDEIALGSYELWKLTAQAPKPLSLGALYAKLPASPPSSAWSWSVSDPAAVTQIQYGKLAGNQRISPLPVAPANFDTLTPEPPTFKWKTRGARADDSGTAGYHFNRFILEFYNKDFSKLVLATSPISAPDKDQVEYEYEPTEEEWDAIKAGNDGIIHWVVRGTDTLAGAFENDKYYYSEDFALGGVNLAFVIDDTGSMSEDIDGVKDGMQAFVDQLEALSLAYKPTIEVITFKDSVQHRVVSNDLSVIRSEIDSLYASGGDDCPEASAEALLSASRNVTGSMFSSTGYAGTVYLATDASPHEGWDIDGIASSLQSRGIRVVSVLTGDCVDTEYAKRARTFVPSENCEQCSSQPYQSVRSLPYDIVPEILGEGPVPSAYSSFAQISMQTGGDYAVVDKGESERIAAVVSNTALGALVPTVNKVSPYDVYLGADMTVTLSSLGANFNSTSRVQFSAAGLTVLSREVIDSKRISARIRVAAPAADGTTSDVTVTTDLGGGETEVAKGYRVVGVSSAPSYPTVVSFYPPSAVIGASTTLRIALAGLAPKDVKRVSVGGTDLTSLAVSATGEVTGTLTVPATAASGSGDVVVYYSDDYWDRATASNPMVFVRPVTASLARLLSLEGGPVVPGKTAQLTLRGENTHFASGRTELTVLGSGVEVTALTVVSATELRVTVSLSSGAPGGFRDVRVRTDSEVVALLNSLEVNATSLPPVTMKVTSKSWTYKGGKSTVKFSMAGVVGPGTWEATVDVPWLHLASSGGTVKLKGGKGTGALAYTVDPTVSSLPRGPATIRINGTAFTVSQTGASCSVKALVPTTAKFTSDGGSLSVPFTVTPADCAWTVTPSLGTDLWVTLTSPASGAGSSAIAGEVWPNELGKPRTGKVALKTGTKSLTITIQQTK